MSQVNTGATSAAKPTFPDPTSFAEEQIFEVVVQLTETRRYYVDARSSEEAEAIVEDLLLDQRESANDYQVEEHDDVYELSFPSSDQTL